MSDFRIIGILKEPFFEDSSGQIFVGELGTQWINVPHESALVCNHTETICGQCMTQWQDDWYLGVVQKSGDQRRIGSDRLPLELPTGPSL